MKSIIEDFSNIASRLNQIEQEKHTAIMTAPGENTAEPIASIYGIQYVDTAPAEYTGFTFTFYPGTESCCKSFDAYLTG